MKHAITLLTALLLALPTALRADDSSKNDAAALIRARTEAAKTFSGQTPSLIICVGQEFIPRNGANWAASLEVAYQVCEV